MVYAFIDYFVRVPYAAPLPLDHVFQALLYTMKKTFGFMILYWWSLVKNSHQLHHGPLL